MSDDRFSVVLKEWELIQAQLDKYDGLSARIKTWAITLWVASLGWSFQIANRHMALLSLVVVLAFWCLDAVNKNFREDYRARRETVSAALAMFFRDGSWPADFTAPQMPPHRFGRIFKYLLELHICLNYLPLMAIAALVYIFIH
ncbi:MAG: hypothetical protein WC453_04225 [Patescibacteria group bacterium]